MSDACFRVSSLHRCLVCYNQHITTCINDFDAQSEPFRRRHAPTSPGKRRRRSVQTQPLCLPPQETGHRVRTARRRTTHVVKVDHLYEGMCGTAGGGKQMSYNRTWSRMRCVDLNKFGVFSAYVGVAGGRFSTVLMGEEQGDCFH